MATTCRRSRSTPRRSTRWTTSTRRRRSSTRTPRATSPRRGGAMGSAEPNGLVAAQAASRVHAAAVAMGEAPADLVLRNGRLVDVYTGRIAAADVAIADDRIASVGEVRAAVGPSTGELDCDGCYVLPGFVEPHLHIGSSQLSIE